MKRSPLNKVGRRTREWARVWQWLKPRFEKAGRTSCEFGFIPHECWGALFPCHAKKRRECAGIDHYSIALGCQQIAGFLDEKLSHSEMESAVMKAITLAGGLILPDELREAA